MYLYFLKSGLLLDHLEKLSEKYMTGLFHTFSAFFEKSMKKHEKVTKSKLGVFLMLAMTTVFYLSVSLLVY